MATVQHGGACQCSHAGVHSAAWEARYLSLTMDTQTFWYLHIFNSSNKNNIFVQIVFSICSSFKTATKLCLHFHKKSNNILKIMIVVMGMFVLKIKTVERIFWRSLSSKLARSSSSFSFLFKILSVVATDPRSSRFITRWFYGFSFERYPREISFVQSFG